MVVVLLASKKAHIWLLSCCHPKKPRYGCCPTSTLKSPNMVDVLPASKKKEPEYGCYPIEALKSPDMVDVMLASK